MDIFDAARRLKKEFGNNTEVLVSNDESGFYVRLSIFTGRQFYHHQFVITEAEINQGLVDIFNEKFNYGVRQLQLCPNS